MAAYDPFAKPEHLSAMQRYREIDRLDRIFRGKQYDGRPDWWNGKDSRGNVVPLRERRPCIRYKLAAAATNQVVRFLFGDKRFPKVSVPFDNPETPLKDGDVSEDESKQLDAWLDELIESAKLQPRMRAAARMGISRKTAVMVFEVVDGEVSVQMPRPQDCYAKFEADDPSKPVVALVWCYEFDKEVTDKQGRPVCERHYFRREWSETETIVYDDVKKVIGKEVEWGNPRRQPHGLKFCPVLWIRNDSEEARSVDGCGLYEGLEEDLEALDMTLSRRHQGVVYFGAPQPYETGVEPGDGPEGDTTAGVGGYSPAGEVKHGEVVGGKRKIAPESMWTYAGENVNVALLETTGKAFEVGTLHVNDIRSRCLESMGVVLTSMSDTVSRVTTGAEMSAKFLALAHAPLIALTQEYRHTWWPHGLKAALSMLMRMVVDLAGSNQTINVTGTEEIVKLLSGFYGKEGKWRCPRLEPKWGQFFEPSSTEVKSTVDAAKVAKESGFICAKTGIQRVAPDFGVDDIQAEREAIEQEHEEAEEKAAERARNETAALHEMTRQLGQAGDDSPRTRQGVGTGSGRDAGPGAGAQGNPKGNDASGAGEGSESD